VDSGTKAAIEAKVKPGSVFNNALMQELFNQGKLASHSDLSFMNGMTVTRNVEKATVNIVFNFAVCLPLKD
jgi:flagellar assembly factor FliW